MQHSAPDKHWAARYIGLPWALGALGPNAFDCWGLVRHVELQHFGRALPPLGAGMNIVTQGWESPAAGVYAAGDIVEMRSARGPHVGIWIEADRRAGVLHSVGLRDEAGIDHGSVLFTMPEALAALGLGRLKLWKPKQ